MDETAGMDTLERGVSAYSDMNYSYLLIAREFLVGAFAVFLFFELFGFEFVPAIAEYSRDASVGLGVVLILLMLVMLLRFQNLSQFSFKDWWIVFKEVSLSYKVSFILAAGIIPAIFLQDVFMFADSSVGVNGAMVYAVTFALLGWCKLIDALRKFSDKSRVDSDDDDDDVLSLGDTGVLDDADIDDSIDVDALRDMDVVQLDDDEYEDVTVDNFMDSESVVAVEKMQSENESISAEQFELQGNDPLHRAVRKLMRLTGEDGDLSDPSFFALGPEALEQLTDEELSALFNEYPMG